MKSQEFIGLEVEIIDQKSNTKTKGKIIDETKNTFKVKTLKKEITILKKNKQFIINNAIISGNDILKRPEERIK